MRRARGWRRIWISELGRRCWHPGARPPWERKQPSRCERFFKVQTLLCEPRSVRPKLLLGDTATALTCREDLEHARVVCCSVELDSADKTLGNFCTSDPRSRAPPFRDDGRGNLILFFLISAPGGIGEVRVRHGEIPCTHCSQCEFDPGIISSKSSLCSWDVALARALWITSMDRRVRSEAVGALFCRYLPDEAENRPPPQFTNNTCHSSRTA